MNIIADRVKERISGSPGTSSTLTLSAAPIGFRRFSSVMSISDTCYAVIENGAAWEIGVYTYTAANTLTRTTVLKSSNSGALISVGSNAFVFISYIADKAIYLDPSGELNLALNALSDVSLTAPASGESLKYNGSSWVNGVVSGYTTEEAQDAVGSILLDTSSVSFSYNDGTPSISASVRSSGVTNDMLATGIDATKLGSGSVSSTELGYLDGVTSSLQVQLDSKYASANPSGYLTASVASATYQPLENRLTAITNMDAINYGLMQFRFGALLVRSMAQIKTDLGLDGYNSGDPDLSPYLTSATAASTYVSLTGSYTNPSWIVSLPNTKVTGLGTLATQSGTFSGTSSGTNTGDQTTVVGITGTKAQFDTAVTDGDFLYVGDAPTSHTHGNITNAGAIGSTTGLPIITTASGVLTVGSFGTTSGTFAAGDDSRITGALSTSTAAATYQPLDSDLTSLASASGSGIYERSGGSWTPVVIGTGLLLGSGTLSNTLDLSSYLTSSVASATYVPLTRTLNGLALSASQTFAVGTSGTDFAISSATSTHTFNIPDASATARGLITTGDQTIAGSKTLTGNTVLTQTVSASGSPTALTLTGAAHTTLALSTEATDVRFNLARTVQFATGALTTQRAMRVQAPTYAFVGASTITTASTLAISGPPVAGTNATITNAYALNVESGNVKVSGSVLATYLTASGYIGVTSGGSNALLAGWVSDLRIKSTWGFSWASSSEVTNGVDLTLLRDAAGTLAQRNGTNAQTLRVYNTYTSSTSYETLNIRGKASANFEIGPENGSAGGTLRGLTIGGYSAGTTTIAPWLTFTNAGAATFSGAVSASNLSGTNTGDQDLSSYATTSALSGYVTLSTTNIITGLKTFRTDGGPLSQTFQCYNPSTANGVQILNYKARGSLATPLYPAANDIILGHYCYGYDENATAFSAVKASYICSVPDAWTATSNSTQWTWVTTDTLDATKTAANRMRLQSDGSLTIGGITQSGGLLELVKSNTGLTGFGTALNRLRLSDSDTTTAANQPIGEIEFYSYDATAPGASVKGSFLCVAESATPAAAFVWGLDTTTGAVSEKMRLSSAGLLSVEGGIKTSKGVYQTTETTNTPTGTTVTITLANNNHQTLALTSATGTVTATLTVPTGSSSGTIIVKQHASAAKDITWAVSAGTITWMGTEPDWAADAINAVRIVSWRYNGSVMYLMSTDVGA
jgi:hypothetical protein